MAGLLACTSHCALPMGAMEGRAQSGKGVEMAGPSRTLDYPLTMSICQPSWSSPLIAGLAWSWHSLLGWEWSASFAAPRCRRMPCSPRSRSALNPSAPPSILHCRTNFADIRPSARAGTTTSRSLRRPVSPLRTVSCSRRSRVVTSPSRPLALPKLGISSSNTADTQTPTTTCTSLGHCVSATRSNLWEIIKC